jgi:hypothetical protein
VRKSEGEVVRMNEGNKKVEWIVGGIEGVRERVRYQGSESILATV